MGSSPANQSTALFTAQTEVDTNTNPASGNSVSSEGTSKELLPAPSPVISLSRQIGYAASVTVFHEVNEPSQAHDQTSECDAEDPFFLVSNRKCSRKATKN
ncbi:BnaC05g15380D [Brassica napus]|uniref:BnaC05g15380D protein n=2 Tax=Brassica napus TaxID=3708 RepID=A0A078HPL8_BRANA|nr:BnaC05g15380D [Brassica napus]